MEQNNQFAVNFDQTAVSPLNSNANVIDPVTGARRQINGGLIFAGQNGAPTAQGNQPAIKAAPRVGAVYSLERQDGDPRRLGPLLLAVELPGGRHQRAGARPATRRRPTCRSPRRACRR